MESGRYRVLRTWMVGRRGSVEYTEKWAKVIRAAGIKADQGSLLVRS